MYSCGLSMGGLSRAPESRRTGAGTAQRRRLPPRQAELHDNGAAAAAAAGGRRISSAGTAMEVGWEAKADSPSKSAEVDCGLAGQQGCLPHGG